MQFRLLPTYVEAIRIADPPAHAGLSVEDREGMRRFQRLLICPGVCREAFRYCRTFVAGGKAFAR